MKKKAITIEDYSLGQRLRYIREQRNLSQAEFAKKVGLSQSSVAQIETGKREPSLETLRKTARCLDIHIATLFASDDVHVFDLPRMRRKYKSAADLTDSLHRGLWNVLRFAKGIGFDK